MLQVESDNSVWKVCGGVLKHLADVFVVELGIVAPHLFPVRVSCEKLKYPSHR